MATKKQDPRRLRALLTDERVVAEMHHLFWIEGLDNAGQRDEGYSCREHAIAAACIAALAGYKAAISWGSVALIGPAPPPSPIGLLYIREHSWAMAEGAGHFDLSLKLRRGDGLGWTSTWPASKLAGREFAPRGRVAVSMTADENEHAKAIKLGQAQALAGRNVYHALYLGREYEYLTRRMIGEADRVTNSPFTARLRTTPGFDTEIFAKAALHLWGVANRHRRPLKSLSKEEAWAEIAALPSGAVDEVARRGRLADDELGG